MKDLYLRTKTEGEMIQALSFARGGEPETWKKAGKGFAFNPIGKIIIKDAILDEDGEVIEEPQFDDRFHANIRCDEEVEKLIPEKIKIKVTNPKNIWA